MIILSFHTKRPILSVHSQRCYGLVYHNYVKVITEQAQITCTLKQSQAYVAYDHWYNTLSLLFGWYRQTCLSPPTIFLPTVPRRVLLLWINFLICVSCHTVLSVPCSLVVTCWEGLTPWLSTCEVFLCFSHFPILCPGSSVVFNSMDSWYVPSLLLCG